jgi:hypothetical protein
MPPAQSLPVVQIERHLWLPGGCGPERCLCSRVRALLLLGTCRDMGHCLQGCKCHAPAEGVAVKSRADNGSYLVGYPSNAQGRDPSLYAMNMRSVEAQRRGPSKLRSRPEHISRWAYDRARTTGRQPSAGVRASQKASASCVYPWKAAAGIKLTRLVPNTYAVAVGRVSEQNNATAHAAP